jgi:hypothetical protein
MSDEFYHAFYSQTQHNTPVYLTFYGVTIGPNSVKKEITHFISANNSRQPLTSEEFKQLLECNSHWPKDSVYIGVVTLIERKNYIMKSSLFDMAYYKIRKMTTKAINTST